MSGGERTSRSLPPGKHLRTYRPGKPSQPQRPIKLTVSDGQVAFRLLCATHVAGGVIGHSGSIVKRLESDTSARIHVEDAVSPSSGERLIHVVGSCSVDRKLWLGQELVEVSEAQLALVRVFERVLEVLEVGDGVVRCRLLLAAGQAGAVIGEGGKIVHGVVKETGAHVKVFAAGYSLPPCAAVSDELLQITGGSLAVKKALVMVSQYLQKKESQASGASSRGLHPSMSVKTNDARTNDKLAGKAAQEVVLKLLCPCDAAGAVIGWKGRKVKTIENETGASICFSAPEAGCNDRVITVSAVENKESHCSAAQNAIVRVFNELTSSDGRGTVTARLLIKPSLAGWLNAGESSIISSIQNATDAKLQILEGSCVSGALTNERIIQIHGEYSSVLVALFQVSWRLRESYFDTLLAPLLPHNFFKSCPPPNEAGLLVHKMNDCRVSEVNGSLPRKFPPSQYSNGHHPRSLGRATELATADGGFEMGSEKNSFVVTNTKVEIAVREDAFGSVYGDDGSNLSRLRQISGATVDVQDPSPGNEGKVIISGTPDQVWAAQSLLRAFMMSAL